MRQFPPKGGPGRRPAGQGTEELTGQIERITFVNEQNGYTVARISSPRHPGPVTIVGNLPAASLGETLEMKGVWEEHPRFGRQFRILEHRTVRPVSVEGITKYLGSGLVKGIGPEMAERITRKFGEKTLEIIDDRVEELAAVEGIGPKRVEMIRRAWSDQKEIRAVMIFLQAHNVGTAHATRIFKKYGQRAIAVVSENPYRLATDIPGIGFQTADRIAREMGFDRNSPARAEAGILYVLNRLSEEGHVFYPYGKLVDRCRELLSVDRDTVTQGLGTVLLKGKIVIEDLNEHLDDFEPNQKAVYLTRHHTAETGIARHLFRIISSPKKIRRMDPHRAVAWVQKKIDLRLAPGQVDAVRSAVSDKVLVITGGPGTGKTTIINAVIRIYRAAGAAISLAAPTGRAAKRMSETSGHRAVTIHRLLEYSWQKGGFQRNRDRPVAADVIILDEVSMIDTGLMYHFLKAVPSAATLILVGDANQLPSVGPGNVLGDIIRSGAVPVIELNEVFRQAQESRIITNAHRINRGRLPVDEPSPGKRSDFYFVRQDDADQVLEVIVELACRRIPARFGMDPMRDIQVLSPMHKGTVGTENINTRLQEVLNPSNREMVRGDRRFRLNDKVMQIRNNYEKEVFNGDIGLISGIDPEKQTLVVTYDERQVHYDSVDLDEIVLAYAITVHKSQGSEYPAVILPLLPQHFLLLQRNLIYTAVTRGRRLVVIVGSRKALAMGVHNDTAIKRFTCLEKRLKG